jgi:hypothetical protein
MATESTLRYLKFDYQSHKDALLQRVRSRWPLVWNDFLNNSFGIVLIDVMAWSTATIAFLINRVAGELFVGTMTLRESAVILGQNYGYQMRGPTPATVACEATMTSVQSAIVTIQQGTLMRTADDSALPFEVAEDYTIAIGDLTPKETVVEIAPGLAGANTLATTAVVTNGSSNVDLSDSAIDLTQYLEAGQTFQVEGESDEYTIFAIEAAPGAVSNNRIVLAEPYTGSSATVDATVYDKRILLVQGQTVTDQFVSPAGETPKFAVKLTQTPVIQGSVDVLVNSESWSETTNLAAEDGEAKVFFVRTFSTGETIVEFGNDVFGAQIPSEASIDVGYRVGGGIGGNVALNAISTSITGLIQSTASPVTVTVTNGTSSGQGGRDAETLEEARTNIPYYVRTNDRAVTIADYQTIASQFTSAQYGSVAYARATVRTENALLEGNVVSIYSWTTGSSGSLENLSPQLKQALKDYVQSKAVGTDYVQILDGSAVPVPLSLRFKALSGFSVTETAQLVNDTVSATVNALRPGQPLIYSDFLRSLDEVFGVDSVGMATPISDLYPSSSTELFTVPQPDYVYDLERNGVGSPVFSAADGANISLYEAQLPVFPLEAWSIRLFLGNNELTAVPGLLPGEALILGSNLSVNTTQTDGVYIYSSTVNLLTGKVSLWLVGAPGDLTMKLIPVTGYSTERVVNVYVGYTGNNTQTKRREIRSAIRAWSDGLTVGGTMYGVQVAGVTSSRSCIEEVVASVEGVESVTRVALDIPANTADRITAIEFELLRVGNVVLNNQSD